ncbi:MAG: TM2 domain-containing protein [Oscillospiraceae bacterium]|nr:TM2 domain-containing protein [Oscillospiraceae bacterium]
MFGAPGGYGGSQQYSDPRAYNNSQPYNNQYGRTNININFNQNNNQNMYVPAGAKNKWVTFFLTLFLGWIGVHRFYEGKIGSGLLWMFTLGLGGFGYFVDLIINFVRLFSKGDYYNP